MSSTMSSEIDYVFTDIDQTTVSAMFFRFVWGNRCGAPCSLHWKTQLKPYSFAFAGNEKPKR